jgi:hypothetical protein
MIFLKIVGTQFSFQQGKIESQKISCVNILERWLNTPTRLGTGLSDDVSAGHRQLSR